jgi:hypothetical protein
LERRGRQERRDRALQEGSYEARSARFKAARVSEMTVAEESNRA